MYRLIFQNGSVAGKVIDVRHALLGIGRSPKNDIQLQEDGISPQHCELLLVSDGLHVKDCVSSNGTFVNGRRVEHQTLLKNGDEIEIGAVRLVVELINVQKAVHKASGMMVWIAAVATITIFAAQFLIIAYTMRERRLRMDETLQQTEKILREQMQLQNRSEKLSRQESELMKEFQEVSGMVAGSAPSTNNSDLSLPLNEVRQQLESLKKQTNSP